MRKGTGAGVYGQSVGRRLIISLGRYATVFQAQIYAILACAHEGQLHGRPQKNLSICSDSQEALKALQETTRMSPLVQQCQKALNYISTWHTKGLYWVPGHTGVRGNKIADKLARDSSVQKFVGPEPSLVVSRQNIRKIRCWLDNQNWAKWQGLGNTQRQARELILGPCLGAQTTFLSFNRTKYGVVNGLLTGHNTLRRHLHLMGLTNSPLCRRCGADYETSAHILCECEALVSLRHAYLGSYSLDPEDIKSISWGLSGTLANELISGYGAQRARQLRPRYIRTVRVRTQMLINQSITCL